MRILFLTPQEYLPNLRGGLEMSTDNLVRRCLLAGHEPAVLSTLSQTNSWFAWKSRLLAKLSSTSYVMDRTCGYPVYRTWDRTAFVNALLRRTVPDVTVFQVGSELPNLVAQSLLARNVPVVFFFRNAIIKFQGADFSVLDNAHFIANSKFTARVFRGHTGRECAIIPPLVEPENYRNASPGNAVLFINPNPLKGLDVALTLAEQCPDIPFIFVESWGQLSDEMKKNPAERAAKLSNIEWLKPTGDMKSLYARAKIVLAPSGALYLGKPVDFVEAWGRIATEAHFSGIPVIASNQGGLPESVGPGGILVDPNADISIWKAALRSLWDDPQRYLELSAQARKYSQRPEIQPQKLFEDFISVCKLAVNGQARDAQ